jgi:6-phosphofructokinase
MEGNTARKGRIAVLTGGGDVPGLNVAIRAVTLRARREGYDVIGIRRGWGGLIEIVREQGADNDACVMPLTEELVNRYWHTGGTLLHSSRTRPSAVPAKDVPPHLKAAYSAEKNDLTQEVLANLEFLGVDALIPIGGDDTLSYAVELGRNGFPVVAIPKTMDNDVPGTDYCIGFGTCVTRTIALANQVRTSAASHERIVVLEVFGRYAGYTALLPTLAGAAQRCAIPEHAIDIEHLTELIVADRNADPDKLATVIVSEGAALAGGEMLFEGAETDQYGHAKLGGIGSLVSKAIKERSATYNGGRRIDLISMNLGYLVRSGDPDVLDATVPLVYGNLAVERVLAGDHGIMVAVTDGRYGTVAIDTVVASKKVIDVARYYDTERYRPRYDGFAMQPMMVVGSR